MAAPGSDPSARAELEERTASALRTAGLLTELGGLDRLYADLYLERARNVLSMVCSRERFLGLVAEHEQSDRIASELGRAVDRGDWRRVQSLARDAGQLRGRVQGSARTRDVAAPVYQVRPLVARPLALSLAGIGTLPADSLRDQMASLIRNLQLLADLDRAQAAFYGSRARHFAELSVDAGSDSSVRVAPEELLSTLREAAARHDFTQVESLATSAAEEHRDAHGHVRPSRPGEELQRRLAAPIPPAALARLGRWVSSLACSPQCPTSRAT